MTRMTHTPTAEQTAIFNAVHDLPGDLNIDALAGTGKSSSALEALHYVPTTQPSILMAAFNKSTADNLRARLPKIRTHVIHAQTCHSAGFEALRKRYKNLTVVKNTPTEQLINDQASPSMAFKTRGAAVKLLRHLKDTIATQPEDLTIAGITRTGLDQRFYGTLDEVQTHEASVTVHAAYAHGMDFSRRTEIDFCDMIWAPMINNLPMANVYRVVIIDEIQDVVPVQFAMMERMLAPKGGRLITVGDRNQTIYDFRGSDPDAIYAKLKLRGATTLPLTTTFRCAIAIVEEAQELVPALQARPGAPIGSVRGITAGDLGKEILAGIQKNPSTSTFVLSRNNADLLTCALNLWRKNVAFTLHDGYNMLTPMFAVLEKLDKKNPSQFSASLEKWFSKEMERAVKAHATTWADHLVEVHAMLTSAVHYAAPDKIHGLLTAMIREKTGVLLSSVHKAKGMEADRVFLLRQTFARHGKPRRDPDGEPMPPSEEELNLEYVAITRAKTELVWVDLTRGYQ